MWILPNNHPLSSAFAQGYVESNEDLKEYFNQSESPLFWKSKPLSWKTYLQRWKKVWWLPHLSGRILKPSTRIPFEAALTELLVATLARASRWQDLEKGKTTRGTSGLSFDDTLRSFNQDGAISRMLQAILRSASMSSSANWKKWVTMLRQESTQRRKSARLIAENGSLSSQLWLTPRVMEVQETYETYLKRMQASPDPKNNTKTNPGNLSMQVQMPTNWATPRTPSGGAPAIGHTVRASGNPVQEDLRRQVQMWGTPTTLSRPRKPETLEKCLEFRKSNGQTSVPLYLEEQVMNWPTPTTDSKEPKTDKALLKEATETRPNRTSFSNLRDAVVAGPMKNWPTPDCSDRRSDKSQQQGLSNLVKQWPTPATRDYKGANGMDHFNSKERPHADQLPNAVVLNSLLDKEPSNTTTKSPARLNPAWSIQLMGTTLQRIFTVPLVTPWWNKQQNSPLETSLEKPTKSLNLSEVNISEADKEWLDWINS